MADCPAPDTQWRNDIHHGTPETRVVKLLVRVDGIIQDVPEGYKLPQCVLPTLTVTAEVDGCGQTLTINNQALDLSGLFSCMEIPQYEGHPEAAPSKNDYPIGYEPDNNTFYAYVNGAWLPISTHQVQADWNEVDPSQPDYINNKPTIPEAPVQSDWNATSGLALILNKPTIPAAQVQSDWSEADSTAPDFIKNKPTITNIQYWQEAQVVNTSITFSVWGTKPSTNATCINAANGITLQYPTGANFPTTAANMGLDLQNSRSSNSKYADSTSVAVGKDNEARTGGTASGISNTATTGVAHGQTNNSQGSAAITLGIGNIAISGFGVPSVAVGMNNNSGISGIGQQGVAVGVGNSAGGVAFVAGIGLTGSGLYSSCLGFVSYADAATTYVTNNDHGTSRFHGAGRRCSVPLFYSSPTPITDLTNTVWRTAGTNTSTRWLNNPSVNCSYYAEAIFMAQYQTQTPGTVLPRRTGVIRLRAFRSISDVSTAIAYQKCDLLWGDSDFLTYFNFQFAVLSGNIVLQHAIIADPTTGLTGGNYVLNINGDHTITYNGAT